MNLHKRMESVVANAPLLGPETTDSNNNLSSFADKNDDFEVHLHPRLLPDEPNEISFDVTEGNLSIEAIINSYADVIGVPRSKYKANIEYMERHESEHWQAAQHLGSTSCHFGVRLYRIEFANDESAYGILPFSRHINFKTTKLGAALISAYPMPPSRGDCRSVLEYGYSGVDELAEIAIKRNRDRRSPHGQFYPVPLSAKTRRFRKIFGY